MRATPLVFACLLPPATAQVAQTEWTSPAPSLVGRFGAALSVSADRVLVGAPGESAGGIGSGAAWVFEEGTGGFTATAHLAPADQPIGAEFGTAAALDGGRAVVGAFRDGLPDDHGSIYVYDETPGGWVESAKLLAVPASEPLELFGFAVALDGDRLAASAPGFGQVFVFELQGGAWTQTAEITSDALAQFGFAVALDGDRLAVGSLEDSTGGTLAGAVYVYEHTGGAWTLAQTLFPFPELGLSHFGRSLALDGDRLVVGSPAFAATGGLPATTFVYERVGGSWIDSAILAPDTSSPLDGFGTAVALRGDRVLVGAPGGDGPGGSSGAAFLFEVQGGVWTQTARLDALDGVPGQSLGLAVAVVGDTLLAGAPRDDDAAELAGSVYVAVDSPAVTAFCHCTATPACGNADAFGGCVTSRGVGGLLQGFGSASASADDLRLELSFLPPGASGLLFLGSAAVAPFPFGDGQRCVGGTVVHRFDPTSADALGSAVYGPGLVALTQATFPPEAVIVPGSQWAFQAWFRDPAGPCGTGSSVTNAVAVSFGP